MVNFELLNKIMESKQNNNKYRAMIRRKSKSRKGKCWANKKKQPECEEMSQCSTSTISNNEHISGERSLQQEDDSIHESRKVFKPLENKSKVKLINTSFSKIENSPSKLKKTRSTTAKLGMYVNILNFMNPVVTKWWIFHCFKSVYFPLLLVVIVRGLHVLNCLQIQIKKGMV